MQYIYGGTGGARAQASRKKRRRPRTKSVCTAPGAMQPGQLCCAQTVAKHARPGDPQLARSLSVICRSARERSAELFWTTRASSTSVCQMFDQNVCHFRVRVGGRQRESWRGRPKLNACSLVNTDKVVYSASAARVFSCAKKGKTWKGA